jgi:hypothetical protein
VVARVEREVNVAVDQAGEDRGAGVAVDLADVGRFRIPGRRRRDPFDAIAQHHQDGFVDRGSAGHVDQPVGDDGAPHRGLVGRARTSGWLDGMRYSFGGHLVGIADLRHRCLVFGWDPRTQHQCHELAREHGCDGRQRDHHPIPGRADLGLGCRRRPPTRYPGPRPRPPAAHLDGGHEEPLAGAKVRAPESRGGNCAGGASPGPGPARARSRSTSGGASALRVRGRPPSWQHPGPRPRPRRTLTPSRQASKLNTPGTGGIPHRNPQPNAAARRHVSDPGHPNSGRHPTTGMNRWPRPPPWRSTSASAPRTIRSVTAWARRSVELPSGLPGNVRLRLSPSVACCGRWSGTPAGSRSEATGRCPAPRAGRVRGSAGRPPAGPRTRRRGRPR